MRISFGCHRNYYTLGTLSNRHLLLIVLKTGGGVPRDIVSGEILFLVCRWLSCILT